MSNTKKRKIIRIAVVAAVIVCLATTAVFAQEIAGFFGFLKYDEIIGENVRDSEFFYADENIEITIEELVSDGMSVRSVIHYHALNDYAAEWLAELDNDPANGKVINYHITMIPHHKDNNTVLNPASCSYGSFPMNEFTTETDKYFICCLGIDSLNYGTNEALFEFSIPGGTFRHDYVDITPTIPLNEYVFEDVSEVDDVYIPTRMLYSPLTISIYGEAAVTGSAFSDSRTFIYYDGGRYDMNKLSNIAYEEYYLKGKELGDFPLYEFGLMGHIFVEDDPYAYMPVTTLNFLNPIDLDLLEGIEIGGVYFPIK